MGLLAFMLVPRLCVFDLPCRNCAGFTCHSHSVWCTYCTFLSGKDCQLYCCHYFCSNLMVISMLILVVMVFSLCLCSRRSPRVPERETLAINNHNLRLLVFPLLFVNFPLRWNWTKDAMRLEAVKSKGVWSHKEILHYAMFFFYARLASISLASHCRMNKIQRKQNHNRIRWLGNLLSVISVPMIPRHWCFAHPGTGAKLISSFSWAEGWHFWDTSELISTILPMLNSRNTRWWFQPNCHLKNICQIGSFPQVVVKIQYIWISIIVGKALLGVQNCACVCMCVLVISAGPGRADCQRCKMWYHCRRANKEWGKPDMHGDVILG